MQEFKNIFGRTVPYGTIQSDSQFFDPNDMIAYSTERYGTVRTYVVDLDRAISFSNSQGQVVKNNDVILLEKSFIDFFVQYYFTVVGLYLHTL